MAIFKKDPNAVLDYAIDWSAYLTPIADTIMTASWILSDGLTKVSQSNTATTASVFLSGGALDGTETATCRIVTSGGRTDDRTIFLKIINR